MKKIVSKLKSIAPILGAFALAFSMVTIADAAPLSGDFITPVDNVGNVSDATGGEDNIRNIVLTIVNFILGFLGLLAVVMVIYGGFLYVTSQGNDDQVSKGKNIIMYAAIGIVIILVSFALVNTLFQVAMPGAQ